MSSFKLKPGSKQIDSIGTFNKKFTGTIQKLSKNFLGGGALGALKGIRNSYGADLKKGVKFYTDRSALIESEAQRFNDSLRRASKRKLDKLDKK